MLGITNTDSTGTKNSVSSYLYAGYKVTDKITPYIRLDNLHYEQGEIAFEKNNMTSFVAGARYQLNYLAVIKLEYQHTTSETLSNADKIAAQVAIGF